MFAKFGFAALPRVTGPAKFLDILLADEELGEPEGGNSFTRKTRPPRCSHIQPKEVVSALRGVPMRRLEREQILVPAAALDSVCREASIENSHR
jgi:hypothetical protein